MSSQKGNASRSRGQKHQNVTVFKNNKYDKSKRTEKINNLEVAEVCRRCKDVISWKIKYKKYKLLSQPKTCTKCHQRKIKDSYHIVCIDCATALNVCCKCGKKEEIVAHKSPTEKERIQTMAQLEAEVKALSERKRRAYYRYMDKLSGKKKKKKAPASETSQSGKEETQEAKEDIEEESAPISLDEYFKNARDKLEELQRRMESDMFDDFDDLDICGSSEDELCEDGDFGSGGDDSDSDCERT